MKKNIFNKKIKLMNYKKNYKLLELELLLMILIIIILVGNMLIGK